MPTDSGTNDILSLGFLHYTTAVSREMSDEPFFLTLLTATKLIYIIKYEDILEFIQNKEQGL